MLQQGPLKSSCSHDQVVHLEEDQVYPSTSYHQQQQLQEMHNNDNTSQYSSSSIANMPRLLITCAQLLSQCHFDAAHRLNGFLSRNSSAYGESTERLVHQFSRALSLRIMTTTPMSTMMSSSSIISRDDHHDQQHSYSSSSSSLESCYLSLNQITPFIRFSHLTANQAILEAVELEIYQQDVHILDFDIMHGLQWPPLMQALAERYSSGQVPMLRITATGHDLTVLNRTGDRLSKFAQSLGLRFQFHPLLVLNEDDLTASLAHLIILPNEALAVNCILYLHRLLKDDENQMMNLFLQRIKALNPTVVTIAEREGNHNNPLFLQRFEESLEHYAAIFDSLEATLPPNSKERLGVEQIWFGREIIDIVAGQGEGRRERHQRFESWEMMLKGSGFQNVPLSPFALSQAKLLLRLHYPSEGYQLQIRNNSFFLGWQNRPLFSVSSWR